MTRKESIEELKSIQYQFQSSLEEATSEYAEEWQKESLQNNKNAVKALDMAIKALEQEQKTGHWIYTLEDWNKWECSECGFTKRTDVHVSIGYKYCPECGARMESEAKK